MKTLKKTLICIILCIIALTYTVNAQASDTAVKNIKIFDTPTARYWLINAS